MADVSIGGLAQAPQLSKKTKPKMVVSEVDSPDCKRCGTSELARSGNSYFVCRKCIASSQKAEATTKTKLTREPNQRSVAAMFQPMKSP